MRSKKREEEKEGGKKRRAWAERNKADGPNCNWGRRVSGLRSVVGLDVVVFLDDALDPV